jgi:hypothetical protein
MIVGVLFAAGGLAIGIPAYTGLWRSWTGPDGDDAWGLGALWIGIGGVGLLIGLQLPEGDVLGDVLGIGGGLIVCFGCCSCWWMVPPLRPRWYRAQYTPLLRRRSR